MIVVGVLEGGVAVAGHIATTSDVVSLTLGAGSASIGGAKETVDSNGIGVAGCVRRNFAAVSRRRRVISVVFRNGVLEIGDDFREERLLFHIGEEEALSGDSIKTKLDGVIARAESASSPIEVFILVWDTALSVGEVLDGETELFQVICALHTTGRFTSRLNGGKEEPD